MSARQRWLWLTAELPSQPTTGRIVYSGALLRSVAETDVDVTVVGYGEPPESEASDDRAAAVTWVSVPGSLRGSWRSLTSRLPNLAYACSGSAMREAVATALTTRWDAIIIDHLQMAWVVDVLDKQAVGTSVPGPGVVVFVTHNHEASVRANVAREASIWNGRRLALSIDARKAASLEQRAAVAADIVTSITDQDSQHFRRAAPQARHLVVTPGWSGVEPTSRSPFRDRPRRIGVLGSFEWHVKQENLRRFLVQADPVLAAAGIEMHIGGRVPADFRASVERTMVATRFVGWVYDVAEFLGSCRIGVVAEPLGGGFKLKSLDYVFHGLPVAAIEGSLAGLPIFAPETMIEASDAGSLADAIVAAVDDPERLERLADAALDRCRAHFAWGSRGLDLRRAVDDSRAADEYNTQGSP